MKKAVIDIGSNTIRSVIYDIRFPSIKPILNERDFVGILGYMQNDVLSADGIERLTQSLIHQKSFCLLAGCADPLCFATASLRYIKNQNEVLTFLKKQTGLSIEILSGEQEAYYDYMSLMHQKVSATGMGLDLGGGSCQLFSYHNGTLQQSASRKLGCLYLYQRFVHGIFPTKSEQKSIKAYVKSELDLVPKKILNQSQIYAMGGCARAACKLDKAFLNHKGPINGYQLDKSNISHILQSIEDLGHNGIHVLSQTIPERVHTIFPGLLTLKTILTYTESHQLTVLKSSVREGYLISHLSKK